MGFPPIYEDLFQNEGEGPLLRPDILPAIELTGDTTGSANCGEDGKWTVETTTPVTVNLTGDVTGGGTSENGVVTIDTSGAAASKLTTPRTIRLTGDSTGEATFDGTEDVEINVTGQFANLAITADRLKDPIMVKLEGDVTGECPFDGSSDLTIATTVATSASADLAKEAAKLETERTIQFTGDTSGSFSFDGTEDENVQLTTDIATRLREAQYVTVTGAVTGRSSAPFDGSDEIVINTEFSAGDGPMVPSADEPTQRYTSTEYTAATNGYFMIYYGNVEAVYVTVHNVTHALFAGYYEGVLTYVPVAKGQTYSFAYEDSWSGWTKAWWLPAN